MRPARSYLLLPADRRGLLRAMEAGADALILDLNGARAPEARARAREAAAEFLGASRDRQGRPLRLARVDPLDSPLLAADLRAVIPHRPDAIVLSGSRHGGDVALLSARIAVEEALAGVEDGATAIIAMATDTSGAVFGLGTYAGASARLAGLSWSPDDLPTTVGAAARGAAGGLGNPLALARSLCLFGAAAAEVPAIDSVYANVRDIEGLRREAEAASRDGFAGKLAIHPDQVPVIHAALTPSVEAVARAAAVVAAFAAAPNAEQVWLDGTIVVRSTLRHAERLLERAKAFGS